MCQVCVNDNYYPTSFNKCKNLGACNTLGNGTAVDGNPPNLTVNSPLDGEVYDSKSVLMDLTINEPSSVYYKDNTESRIRWKRLSSNTQDYFRKIRFDEGFNNITIKVRDRNDNEVKVIKQFRVDSRKPKIKRTEPRRDFASGFFEVQFQEDNSESLILFYGNSGTGMRNVSLDLGECYLNKRRYYCDVQVDLEDYNEQDIEYWFELVDIAGTSVESKHIWLSVDTVNPILHNDNVVGGESDSFWHQGEGRYSKYVYFNLNITEPNFDEAVYSYLDSRGKTREKRLCSRLKDGMCKSRKSFRRGHYDLNVEIRDEAGNAIAYPIEFDVVY